MWSIDKKLDDGKPGLDYIKSLKKTSTWNPNCTTSDVETVAEYEVSNRSLRCSLSLEIR